MKKVFLAVLTGVLLSQPAFAADFVTRAEFLEELGKSGFIEEMVYSERFADVTYKDSFSDIIEGAVISDVIDDTDYFKPKSEITRGEGVAMCIRALLYMKSDLGKGDYISLAKKHGLIEEDANLYEYMTDEECDKLLKKMTEVYEKLPLATGNKELDKSINAVRDGLDNCENETAKKTAESYYNTAIKKIIQNNNESEVTRAKEEILLAEGAINYNRDSIKPGSYIFDDNGGLIQGHGGNVFFDEKTQKYYWYGEARQTSAPPEHLKKYSDWGWRIGVACYSSTDLYNWEYESLALEMIESYEGMTFPESDIRVGEVIERPKVMYNAKTDKYVMWMHIDNGWYGYSRAGVAVSDSPTGPFDYITSYRPGDKMSRDMTVFQDNDGTAYIYFSTDENGCLATVKLSEDYLEPVGEAHYCIWWKWREAPTVFRYKDTYYMITSGCSGWSANEADYATAPSPTGPWTQHGNPCVGEGANKTFGGQSYWVMTIDQEKGHFVFMADIWRPSHHSESSYIWLPIQIQPDGSIKIEWADEWRIEDMGNMIIEPDDVFVTYGEKIKLPETVKAVVRGAETDVKVTWEKADIDKVGHHSVTGKVHGFENSSVTLDVYVMPKDVIYFADCGADNTNELDRIEGELYNSAADQAYGVDEKTGKKWGYTADTESGHSSNNNMFYSVRYDYSKGGEESIGNGITYSFEVEKDETYKVYVGVKDPWNEEGRCLDIKVGDKLIADGFDTHNKFTVFEEVGVRAKDGVITVSSLRDEKSLKESLDPIISFIVIAEDDGVVYTPEKFEEEPEEPMEEVTEEFLPEEEETIYRSIRLKGTVLGIAYTPKEGLQLKPYNGTSRFMWNLGHTLTGSYVIEGKVPYVDEEGNEKGQCLDVLNHSKDAGVGVIAYRVNNTANQKWFFEKQSDGTYMIKSENSGLYLTYENGGLIQQEAGYNEYQNWILEVKQ